MNYKTLKLNDLCMIGMFSAVIVIMAQLAIPMPSGVPMTMQTFAITLAAIVLGAKRAALATSVYLLIGAIGLPVFANFTGGLSSLVGPTGGFLISFPIMAFVIGLGNYKKNKALFLFYLIIGTVLNYFIGCIMFSYLMEQSLTYAFTVCVLPFIPTTIIKMILATLVGLPIRTQLNRFNLTTF
ncbi:MAG: biotin transporter BioY [Lachnospiraceae bacterium]